MISLEDGMAQLRLYFGPYQWEYLSNRHYEYFLVWNDTEKWANISKLSHKTCAIVETLWVQEEYATCTKGALSPRAYEKKYGKEGKSQYL